MLLGKLVFLPNLFWLLSLMEHILMIKATISPEGKNASVVKSLAKGLTVCKCLRHHPGVGREGGGGLCSCDSARLQKEHSPNLQGRKRMDRSLIFVLAWGHMSETLFQPLQKALSAVLPRQ